MRKAQRPTAAGVRPGWVRDDLFPFRSRFAEFGSMPITTLAVQFWAFCASTSRADGDRWLHPGADGRRSGQSR